MFTILYDKNTAVCQKNKRLTEATTYSQLSEGEQRIICWSAVIYN